MKKYKLLVLSILFLVPFIFLFSACEPDKNLLDFDDISIQSANYDYDGEEKSLSVIGDLPDGAKVTYKNNKATNAGTYHVEAKITCEGYKTKTLRADLIINKINITGITFSKKIVYFNNEEKSVTIEGALPSGVKVSYTNNKAKEVGTYNASVTITGANYNTLTLTAQLVVLPNLTQFANTVLTGLMNVPDPWSFLPESFSLKNKAYTGDLNIDYSNFVAISSLPQTGMGKQMNVVYSTLLNVEDALYYLRKVYQYMGSIVTLYQNYINANPEEYKNFETTTENFTFKIQIQNDDYSILVNYKSVAIELAYNSKNQSCCGRIQLSNSNVIKYEMSANNLTIASNVIGLALTKIHFERKDNLVSGYVYEYYGTEESNIKTSALIKIDNNYTSIISNK